MKPHIVAIPLPVYGHITPMLHLCSSILTSSSSSTFSITFVITESSHSVVASHPSLLRHRLDIRRLSIPDGLPSDIKRLDYDVFRSSLDAWANLRDSFELLLENLASPVHCILSDVYLGWTQDTAIKLGVPRVALWTSNASECQVYLSAARLISEGVLPFKAPANRSAGDVDELIPKLPGTLPLYHRCYPTEDRESRIHVPGLPPLHRAEFPSLLQIEDAGDVLFHFFVDQAKRMPEAGWVLVNSFLELESAVVEEIRGAGVRVSSVGPLHLLGGRGDEGGKGEGGKEECMRWLDKQGVGSVVYVAFGSWGMSDEEQVEEMARGLEQSDVPFLWAVQALRGGGEALKKKMVAFIERTSHIGLVVPWAPQPAVLSHPAVGAFLSHCGWNSTLESLAGGTPLLCCPFAGDQLLTCKLVVDRWCTGLRFDEVHPSGFPTSACIARSMKALLQGEACGEIRDQAVAHGDAARHAVQPSGDSRRSLLALIESVIQSASIANDVSDIKAIT